MHVAGSPSDPLGRASGVNVTTVNGPLKSDGMEDLGLASLGPPGGSPGHETPGS